MSRRPISNQGKAKPEVKSNPTRPHTTTARAKQPLDTLKAQEEENKRKSEMLEREFPEISKQCELFMDPNNTATLESFLQDLGSKFGVDTSSIPDYKQSVEPLTIEAPPVESLVPNFDKLLQSLNQFKQNDSIGLGSVGEQENEFIKLNDQLNAKNAAMMDDCRALLMKLGQDPTFEQDSPPQTENLSANFDSIKAREKEYVRLNEELDKKNALVTKQTEDILSKQRRKEQLQTSKPSSKKPPQTRSINKPVKPPQAKPDSIARPPQDTMLYRTESEESIEAIRNEILSGTDFSETIRRIEAQVLEINNPEEFDEPTQQVAEVPQQDINVTQFKRQSSGQNLDRPCTAPGPVPKTAGGLRPNDSIRDIEPPEEVGAEAIQRFLKAKLNVLQEELDRASEEIARKDADLQECKKELLAKQEQAIQLDRHATSLRSVSEKQQKKLDLVTNELDNSKLEIAGLKRDLDSCVRNQKKIDGTQSAVEVRLNRALEEIEKHKSIIQHLKSDTKDTQHSSGRKLEELRSENKVLFKQRDELMTGFKKQMKLIDNLKRQKMHIEAAKMLAFSEEEFMRVLDWWKVKD